MKGEPESHAQNATPTSETIIELFLNRCSRHQLDLQRVTVHLHTHRQIAGPQHREIMTDPALWYVGCGQWCICYVTC